MKKMIEENKKIKNFKKNHITRLCFPHKTKGNNFCKSCSSSICCKCISEGTHSGHDICDLEDDLEVRGQILNVENFCQKLENSQRIYQQVKAQYYDDLEA